MVRRPISPRAGIENSRCVMPVSLVDHFQDLAATHADLFHHRPTSAAGTSTTRISNGSCQWPSICLRMTCGLPTDSS